MDLENKKNTYTLKQIETMFLDYVNARLQKISDMSGKDEYEYSEMIGRIKELRTVLKDIKTINTVENKQK